MGLLNWELIVSFLVGVCITLLIVLLFCCCKYHRKNSFDKIINAVLIYLPLLWYPLIFLISTIYVCCNFSECLNFQFFSDFQGDNLIFLIWLLLWLLPLFDKFEIFGANFKLRLQSDFFKKTADDAIKDKGEKDAKQLKEMIVKQEDKEYVE